MILVYILWLTPPSSGKNKFEYFRTLFIFTLYTWNYDRAIRLAKLIGVSKVVWLYTFTHSYWRCNSFWSETYFEEFLNFFHGISHVWSNVDWYLKKILILHILITETITNCPEKIYQYIQKSINIPPNIK